MSWISIQRLPEKRASVWEITPLCFASWEHLACFVSCTTSSVPCTIWWMGSYRHQRKKKLRSPCYWDMIFLSTTDTPATCTSVASHTKLCKEHIYCTKHHDIKLACRWSCQVCVPQKPYICSKLVSQHTIRRNHLPSSTRRSFSLYPVAALARTDRQPT